jgi:hypothetical protein
MLCALLYIWRKSPEDPKDKSKWVANEEMLSINQAETGDKAALFGAEALVNETKVDGSNGQTLESAANEAGKSDGTPNDKESQEVKNESTGDTQPGDASDQAKVNTFGKVVAETENDIKDSPSSDISNTVISTDTSDVKETPVGASTFMIGLASGKGETGEKRENSAEKTNTNTGAGEKELVTSSTVPADTESNDTVQNETKAPETGENA